MWRDRFFFQAKDGIRDPLVTGVQTCALPICLSVAQAPPPPRDAQAGSGSKAFERPRSEERRVGKDCRFRRTSDHSTKTITNNAHAKPTRTSENERTSYYMCPIDGAVLPTRTA